MFTVPALERGAFMFTVAAKEREETSCSLLLP